MAEGEKQLEHSQMAEITKTDDQDDEKEKIAKSENVLEGDVKENGDVKERGEKVDNEVEVVKDGMEENGDAKKEETQIDGGIKNEDGKGLGEEIVNGVKEETESNKNDAENRGSKEENEKKNEGGEEVGESKKEDENKNEGGEAMDEPKQDEKKDSGNEENGELKKEDDEKNEGGEEKGESKQEDEKKEDEQKNEGDGENGALKEEDEIKNRGDGENDESKKEDEKNNEGDISDALPCNVDVNSSLKEEDRLLSELKENERIALVEIKKKLEEAIKENRFFKETKSLGNDNVEEKGKTREKFEGVVEEAIKMKEEGKKAEGLEKKEQEDEGKEESPRKDVEEKEIDAAIEEGAAGFNMDISLWGVPLLPSKEDKATDVLLLKFLRARDYNSNEAFEMLRNTLQWRKECNIDSVLNEDFGDEFSSTAYMNGKDNEGHPVCYNIFGVLDNDEMYKKTLITEEKRDRFLRWRVQLMEKGVQQLDFNPNGVSCLLQISDLKNTPGPSKKEVRLFARQGVSLLLDNYPEFVTKHIFINVPFWYYAFTAVLSPFLTPRTKSKFIYARPSKVTETLLKYIAAEEIPIQYGGLKRENDTDFSIEDAATEVVVKSGTTESIEIQVPDAGSDIVWEVMVLGWEVNYKEEFVPSDEGSYAISVQKGKRIGSQEGSIRNSFENKEPGKVVISVENSSFKKRRVFYRYKIRSSPPS